MFLRMILLLILVLPQLGNAQSFSNDDIDRILLSYELGAREQLEQLKIELIDSETGFKLLQGTPEHSTTQIFVEFGQRTNSKAIKTLEKIRESAGFRSIKTWALTHDRILGIANAALMTGWGLHSKDPRYSDPDYPDTLAFMYDTTQPWKKRVQAIDEFKQWCESLCVNADSQEEDIRVLAPRYVYVVKQLFPPTL